jgi:methyltransferase (TIGR00027 family)
VTVLAGVGRTAFGAAMFRAAESRRSDRLFHDPYAAAFRAAAPAVFDREQRGTVARLGMASWGAACQAHVVIRTRFFDDFLRCATGQGIHQVVLVASGLDTRAYRLAWPANVQLFEVDLPEVLGFKRRVLEAQAAVPRCDHRLVPADLREDWTTPLTDAGLHPDEPTVWLLEGLLIYLSAGEAGELFTTIGGLSTAGSRLAFESDDPGVCAIREQARTIPAIATYTELWKGGLPDAPGWLTARDWRLTHHDRGEAAAGYGRAVSEPSSGGFITAVRG